MAACAPTPTQTLYGTQTITTSSVSTTFSTETSLYTTTILSSTTSCVLREIFGGSQSCVSSTVIVSSIPSIMTTTIPHPILTTVPSVYYQTNPTLTLFATCPDTPNPPSPTPTPSSDPPTSAPLDTSTSSFTVTRTTTGPGGVTRTSTSTSTDSQSPTGTGDGSQPPAVSGAVIGGVVGGVIGIIGLIVLVWFLLRRREQTKYRFDEDDYGTPAVVGGAAGGKLSRRGRSVNLDDEIKAAGGNPYPYQYGMVGGGTQSPTPGLHSQNFTTGYHSQNSTTGYQNHQRSSSRDALMGNATSASTSPRHYDALLPGSQRLSQHSSSGAPESIMMTNQQPGSINRASRATEDPWAPGHHARPSSAFIDGAAGTGAAAAAAAQYAPGHGGFYQQYGPMDHPNPPAGQMSSPPPPPHEHGMYTPPMDPGMANAAPPPPSHKALYTAAGLGASSMASSSRPTQQVVAAPPPGAGGARQYTMSVPAASPPTATAPLGLGVVNPDRKGPLPGLDRKRGGGDPYNAGMTSADNAASSAPTTVGFGRQRTGGEKSPTPQVDEPVSPVVQHQDGGRVPQQQQQQQHQQQQQQQLLQPQIPGDAPPAYSDS